MAMAWLIATLVIAGNARATELGIDKSAFTLDARPTFLLGASYYGALGASEDFIRRDLDDLERHGFNWIRVWATWTAFTNDVSAVDSDGKAREPFLGKLAWLVGECDRRGMVVDITLTRGDGPAGQTHLATFPAHQRAVETLVGALKPHRNWYLDLANERNIRDARFVSVDELRRLREAVKRLDPARLVTASHAGGDLAESDVRKYLLDAQLDFLAPHRPRERGSAAETEAKTKEALAWMQALGRIVPILYQEPFRRGYGGWQPGAGDFAADLAGARQGGAAGWCWHNGDTRGSSDGEPRRSFDLRQRRLFDQLDDQERRFLASLPKPAPATVRDPGQGPWPTATPADEGLDAAALRDYSDYMGGRGCVVRHGRLVYSWGDITRAEDVASAVKPFFSFFLFKALENGRIPSLDEKVVRYEPRLADLNAALGYKDREIAWRHLANQISCYGLAERPGTAFCYNDWQMALFADLLFKRVYGVNWAEVDSQVLHPMLTDLLGCQDHPSLIAFGTGDRAGRLAISPRDFARFGQLFLQRGRWGGRQVLREDLTVMAVTSPLPASLPRAGKVAAEMVPGQRTLGSREIPDNQTEHFGSYSWLWWVNGVEVSGKRHWPDAPADLFAALGHGGIRGVAVMPGLDLIVSWNDGRTDNPAKENEAYRRLMRAVQPEPKSSATPTPVENASTKAGEVQAPSAAADRLRLIIETDAGGDPDDEQSLVRFLLYANEWDVEGIIANRPQARAGENRNPERTGLGVVRRQLTAYGECWTNLVQNDPRYPTRDQLWSRTVAGYNDTEAAVNLLIAAVDRPDPRPLWYADWGSDNGAATNNLRRALDRVLRDRGPAGYAQFKSRLRLSSYDNFGDHTAAREPPFPLWVNTFQPELDGRRWYHRFSALTAKAGGFDLVRDCLTGHGQLGPLYPTNTNPRQKEGDSMSFLYLIPTGMNDPEHPQWGSWAGRYGHNENQPGKPYFWANQTDFWEGSTNRDNALRRWAADLQNDFRARLDWCVKPPSQANHPPVPQVCVAIESAADKAGQDGNPAGDLPSLAAGQGVLAVTVPAGSTLRCDAGQSHDLDGDRLSFAWFVYPEAGTYRGAVQVRDSASAVARLVVPAVTAPESLHLVLRVSDAGQPPLARYTRVVVTVLPRESATASPALPANLKAAFAPPHEFAGDLGNFASVLRFADGRPVKTPADWTERRAEIRQYWQQVMGPWPPLIARPRLELLRGERREDFTQQRVRVEIAPGQTAEGWLLTPDGPGPFPAVLVPFYEPETSIGLGGKPGRDFAYRFTKHGFVSLAIGSPGGDAWKPATGEAACQPLSFLAYVAANCANALANLPSVDPARLGIVGHSYGGKWALFAGALCDRFAAVVVSDPGIVWDETRPNVNYWEPWYLGRDAAAQRKPGIPTADNPRTGAYRQLFESGHDLPELIALIAPRPLLVSGGSEDPPERWRALNAVVAVNTLLGRTNRVALTSRASHDPTAESSAQVDAFLTHFLGGSHTRIAIVGGRWQLNGEVTYRGALAEGLLLNVRMVNAVFEDRRRADFDPDTNTTAFIERLPEYVAHGVRAFTLNLQGGTPGYEGAVNSAFAPDGSLRESYLRRVQRVIEPCDRQGAAVILGCFYQRQDQVLTDDSAVRAGVVNVARWLREAGYHNVILEIANEFQHDGFDRAILKTAAGQVELIRLAKRTAPELLVSTSGLGHGRMDDPVAEAADFILVHFNGTKVADIPARIAALRRFGKPIVCNEDDKVGAAGVAALEACVASGASWGFMAEKVNQAFPFRFGGAADDPAVYAEFARCAGP